jgi:adenylate kinase family enzyme
VTRPPVNSATLPVVLIGPVNAGKSTIAALLAERLSVSPVSLDDLCWGYFEQAGYDRELARQHFEHGGQVGALGYMIHFYPPAVQRIVSEHPQKVIELGAGHTVYDDPEQLGHVRRALSSCSNIVLLLPSPDPDEALRILNARESNPHPEILAMNERFVRNPSNRELATITVYTKDRTPAQTCAELLAHLH